MRNQQLAGFVTFMLALGAGCDGTTQPTPTDRTGDNGLVCSSCSGETVCVNGVCEGAFPRFYRISIGRVFMPNNKPDGSCWDEPNCGAPDPQVQIKLNDEKVGEFNSDDDHNDVTFNESIDVQLIAGSTIEVQLQDEDLIDSELVLECRYSPITAEKLRSGNLGCTDIGSSIDARISVPGQAATP